MYINLVKAKQCEPKAALELIKNRKFLYCDNIQYLLDLANLKIFQNHLNHAQDPL